MKIGFCLVLLVQAALTVPGDFLSKLEGTWRGRAVHTPIGPAPYNVNFSKTGADCVSGVVSNRLSRHTWTFCRRDGGLRLRFLTDFRGNDTPILFAQSGQSGGVYSFRADSHPFMLLQAFIENDRGWIKVMHHGRLHVEIHLSREPQ